MRKVVKVLIVIAIIIGAIVIYKARRTDEEATISITGRTVESLDLKAVFDKDTCKWRLLGEATEYERQKQIAEYENNPIVATVKKLVSTNDLTVTQYKKFFLRLLNSNVVSLTSTNKE